MRGLLVGYGRMGRAIEEVLLARGHEVAGKVTSVGPAVWPAATIAFEFTNAAAAPSVLSRLAEQGISTVSGSTGWDGVERVAGAFGQHGAAFLHSANFSLGMNVMYRVADLLGAAAAALPGYDGGLVERHHTRKKDAPSGTAREIARSFEARSGRPLQIVALRQGGQPGEHRLILEGPDESIEVVHRARSPRLFAEGAVKAAEWLLASGARGAIGFGVFIDSILEEVRT